MIGVVQIINRRSRNGTRVIPFTPVQAELGVAIGQVISRIIEAHDSSWRRSPSRTTRSPSATPS